MSSLYQLTDEFLELYESDEINEQKLEETALAIKNKSEKAALFLKCLESDSKQIDNVIAELHAKKKTIDNKLHSFKEYVKINMEKLGMEKLEAGIFRFTICKNGGKKPVLINLPPEEIDKAIENRPDRVVVIRDGGIIGVGIFVTLFDETYKNLENLNPKDVNVLIRFFQETGNNIHFLLIATEGFKNIMLLGEEVRKITTPKTVSWWNPGMTKLHKYKLGG